MVDGLLRLLSLSLSGAGAESGAVGGVLSPDPRAGPLEASRSGPATPSGWWAAPDRAPAPISTLRWRWTARHRTR